MSATSRHSEDLSDCARVGAANCSIYQAWRPTAEYRTRRPRGGYPCLKPDSSSRSCGRTTKTSANGSSRVPNFTFWTQGYCAICCKSARRTNFSTDLNVERCSRASWSRRFTKTSCTAESNRDFISGETHTVTKLTSSLTSVKN